MPTGTGPQPDERPPSDLGVTPAPATPGDGDWDELLLVEFGPRHWNLGCG